MAEAKSEQEPSIEEILESIRQIISDDGEPAKTEAAPAAVLKTPEPVNDKAVPLDLNAIDGMFSDKVVELSLTPEAPAPMPAAPADDILDLTEKVTPPPVDIMPEAAPTPAAMELDMLDKPVMDMPMTEDVTPVAAPAMFDDSMGGDDANNNLISAQTAAAATEALSKLLAGNIAVEKDEVGRVGKVTLEDMTREMMKPMIKTWLDQNLPTIIEKIVQREVEKLARRAMDR